MQSAGNDVRDAYDGLAQLYAELFLHQLDHLPMDRAFVDLFIGDVKPLAAPVIDVGCGPGHVAAYISNAGVEAMGVDHSPAMIAIARDNFPTVQFDCGDMAALASDNHSVAGIVARYSTIHRPPHELGDVLAEFARVLMPGGTLKIGFFGTFAPSDHGKPFDHKVTTAYRCDPDQMAAMLDAVGLVERSRHIRQPSEGERYIPQVTLFATPRTLRSRATPAT